MQRIFKYDNTQNISLTPNKKPNILTAFILGELCTLKNVRVLLSHPYNVGLYNTYLGAYI